MNEELRRLYRILMEGAHKDPNAPIVATPRDYSVLVRDISEDDFVSKYSDRAALLGFLNDVKRDYPNFYGTKGSPEKLISKLSPVDDRKAKAMAIADQQFKQGEQAEAQQENLLTKYGMLPGMPSDNTQVIAGPKDKTLVRTVLRDNELRKEFKPGELGAMERYAAIYPERLQEANKQAALVQKEFQKDFPDGMVTPYEIVFGPGGKNTKMSVDEVLRAESIPGLNDEQLLQVKRRVSQQKLLLAEQESKALQLHAEYLQDEYNTYVTPEIQETMRLVNDVVGRLQNGEDVKDEDLQKAYEAQQALEQLPEDIKSLIDGIGKGTEQLQRDQKVFEQQYPELQLIRGLNERIQMQLDRAASLQDAAMPRAMGYSMKDMISVMTVLRGFAEVIPRGAEELASTYNALSGIWSDDAKARLIRRAHRDVMPGTYRDTTKEMRPPMERTAFMDDGTGRIYEIGFDDRGNVTNIYTGQGYQARLMDDKYQQLISKAEDINLFETSKSRINGSSMFNNTVDGISDLAVTYLLARGVGSFGKMGKVGQFLAGSGPVSSRVREALPILFQYTGRIAEEGIRQGLSPEAAITYGGFGSAAEAMIEGAVPFLGKVTGSRKMALRNTLKNILADPSELKKLKKGQFMETAVLGTLGESGEEVAAAAMQPITNKAINELFNTKLDINQPTIEEYVSSAALGMFVAGLPGVIGGLANSTRVGTDAFMKESIFNAVIDSDRAQEIAASFGEQRYTDLGQAIQETKARTVDILEAKKMPLRKKMDLVAMTFDVVKKEMDLERAKGTGSEREVQDDLNQRISDLDNERAAESMPETDDRPITSRVKANTNGRIGETSWTGLRPGDIVQVEKVDVTPDGIKSTGELEPAEVDYVDPEGEYVQFKGQGENSQGFRKYKGTDFGNIFLPEETEPLESELTDDSGTRPASSQREVQAQREELERRRKAELAAPAPGQTPEMINERYDAELASIENKKTEGSANDQNKETVPISSLERPNGAIGTQGVTEDQIRGILENVLGLSVPKGATMREMVDLFKSDPTNVDKLVEFTNKNPIDISTLPDGTVQINDGHHRAFLLQQAGVSDIAVKTKENQQTNNTISSPQNTQTDATDERSPAPKTESESSEVSTESEGAVEQSDTGREDALSETPVETGEETKGSESVTTGEDVTEEEETDNPDDPAVYRRANGSNISYSQVREVELANKGKFTETTLRTEFRLGPAGARSLMDSYNAAKKNLSKDQRSAVDNKIKENESQAKDKKSRKGQGSGRNEEGKGTAKSRLKTAAQKIAYARNLFVGNNARGMALQFLLDNKIGKNIIQQLYGGQRRGGASRSVTEETKNRRSYIDKEGIQDIAALADALWGYFGSPEDVDIRDIRDALEEVIGSHSTRQTMAEELIDTYDVEDLGMSPAEKALMDELQEDYVESGVYSFVEYLTDEEIEAIVQGQYDFENSPEYQEWLESMRDQPEEQKMAEVRSEVPVTPPAQTTPEPVPADVALVPELETMLTDVFGLNAPKAKVAARILNLLIRTMAARAGITPRQMYNRISFRKGTVEDAKRIGALGGITQEEALTIQGATLVENGKRIIVAFQSANISTAIHEVAHVFEKFLTPEEKQVILRESGHLKWTAGTSEYFARGFEKYLMEGVSPTPELAVIFDKVKQFFIEVYRSISHRDIDIPITPEIRQLYARMLGYELPLSTFTRPELPDLGNVDDIGDWLLNDEAPLFQVPKGKDPLTNEQRYEETMLTFLATDFPDSARSLAYLNNIVEQFYADDFDIYAIGATLPNADTFIDTMSSAEAFRKMSERIGYKKGELNRAVSRLAAEEEVFYTFQDNLAKLFAEYVFNRAHKKAELFESNLKDYVNSNPNERTIKRLYPHEEEGRKRGGRTHEELSILLQAGDRTNAAIERGIPRVRGRQGGLFIYYLNRQVQAKEEKIIEEYATSRGLYYPFISAVDDHYGFTSLGNGLPGGSESIVRYDHNTGDVYKYTDIGFQPNTAESIYGRTWINFLDRVALQNTYFEETGYTVEGFVRDGGGKLRLVLKQPYIKAAVKERADGPVSTFESRETEIRQDLARRGFTQRGPWGGVINPEAGVFVGDINSQNMIKGKDGQIYYIDPVISLAFNTLDDDMPPINVRKASYELASFEREAADKAGYAFPFVLDQETRDPDNVLFQRPSEPVDQHQSQTAGQVVDNILVDLYKSKLAVGNSTNFTLEERAAIYNQLEPYFRTLEGNHELYGSAINVLKNQEPRFFRVEEFLEHIEKRAAKKKGEEIIQRIRPSVFKLSSSLVANPTTVFPLIRLAPAVELSRRTNEPNILNQLVYLLTYVERQFLELYEKGGLGVGRFSNLYGSEMELTRQIKKYQDEVIANYLGDSGVNFYLEGVFANEKDNKFIGQGGYSKVYYNDNSGEVTKFKSADGFNTAYIPTWTKLLDEITMQNHFFGETGYRFKGFGAKTAWDDPEKALDMVLVLEQPYVKAKANYNDGFEDTVREDMNRRGFAGSHGTYYNDDADTKVWDVREANVILAEDDNPYYIDPFIEKVGYSRGMYTPYPEELAFLDKIGVEPVVPGYNPEEILFQRPSTENEYTKDPVLNNFLNALNQKAPLTYNPFDSRNYLYGDKASLSFSRFNKKNRNEVELQNLSVFEKGTGIGSSVMQDIISVADALGTKITLDAYPFGGDQKALGIEPLVNFYKKFGFEADLSAYGGEFKTEKALVDYAKKNDDSVPMFRNPGTSLTSRTPITVADVKLRRAKGDLGEFDGVVEVVYNKEVIGRMTFDKGNTNQWLDWDKEGPIDLLSGIGWNKEEAAQYFVDKYNQRPAVLLAPNGKPSNLSPGQYFQVRTNEFKTWFGDWEKTPEKASKVVDENGEPQVVYHGTQNKFTKFEPRYSSGSGDMELYMGKGFYFTNDLVVAESYGKVLAVFLNIRNPLISTERRHSAVWSQQSFAEDFKLGSYEEIQSNIKKRGHDGVAHYSGEPNYSEEKGTSPLDYEEYVVFESNQVKSATDNVGTFRHYEDDILFQKPSPLRRQSRQVSLFDLPKEQRTEVEVTPGKREEVAFTSTVQGDYPVAEKDDKNVRTVQGVWEEQRNISFTGGAKVQGPADVAFLMRALEDRSVEQFFAIHVDEEDRAHIQYMSTGAVAATVVDVGQIVAGVKRFNSKKVYIVHNHPSGQVNPSPQDVTLASKVHRLLYNLGVGMEAVIMDTYNQTYSVFTPSGDYAEMKRPADGTITEQDYTPVAFHGAKFLSEPVAKISTSDDAARAIIAMRFSALPKAGMLILNRRNHIIGNYVFSDGYSFPELVMEITSHPTAQSVIMYGNKMPPSYSVRSWQSAIKDADLQLLDYVTVEGGKESVQAAYESMADKGLMADIEAKYGTNDLTIPAEPEEDPLFQRPKKKATPGTPPATGMLFGGALQSDLFTLANNTPPSLTQIKATTEALEKMKEFDMKRNGGMLAPNGAVSNLSLKQYNQVRTPQFKAWFGDWENDPANASKVVDENGEPLVVYHGTGSVFTKFDSDYGPGSGFYFTPDKDYAQDRANVRAMDPADKRVMELFLNIRNPETVAPGINYATISDLRRTEGLMTDGYIGFESIMGKKSSVPVYVALRPNQIKSATANVGSFDPRDEDILFQRPNAPVKVFNAEIAKRGVNGKLLTDAESKALQKEIVSNYSNDVTEVMGLKGKPPIKQDLRMLVFSYDEPILQTKVRGVDVRIAEGFVRGKVPNRYQEWILYANGKPVGVFSKPEDAKKVVDFIKNNLIPEISSEGSTPLFQRPSWVSVDRENADKATVVKGFYSPIEQRILNTKISKQSAQKWKAVVGQGEESKWTGMQSWLDSMPPGQQLSKDDILDFIAKNKIEVSVIRRGEKTQVEVEEIFNDSGYRISWNDYGGHTVYTTVPLGEEEEDGTYEDYGEEIVSYDELSPYLRSLLDNAEIKYEDWVSPGDYSSYQEVLVTVPIPEAPELTDEQIAARYFIRLNPNDYFVERKEKGVVFRSDEYSIYRKSNNLWLEQGNVEKETSDLYIIDRYIKKELSRARESYKKGFKKDAVYDRSHWDVPNVVVHVRGTTRSGTKGELIYHIEEIQSDWGEQGRERGFGTQEKLPDDFNAEEVTAKHYELEKTVHGPLELYYEFLNHSDVVVPANEKLMKIKVYSETPSAKRLEWLDAALVEKKRQMEARRELFKDDPPEEKEAMMKRIDSYEEKINRDYTAALAGVNVTAAQYAEYVGTDYLVRRMRNPHATQSRAIPEGPFVQDVNSYTKLGLKIAAQQAIRAGASILAWNTGERVNDTFDLNRVVNSITKTVGPEGIIDLDIDMNTDLPNAEGLFVKVSERGEILGKTNFLNRDLEGEPLSALIGAELAKKVMEAPSGAEISGNDLNVGGRAMIGYYGSVEQGLLGIVGGQAKKLFGQDIAVHEMFGTDYRRWKNNSSIMNRTLKAHGITLTDEIIDAVEEGVPLFQMPQSDPEALRDQQYTLRDPMNNVLVFVSPDKLLARHDQDDPSFSMMNPKNRIGNRVGKAKQFLRDYVSDPRMIDPRTNERINRNVTFEPSIASLNNGRLGFTDGRHRILAASEEGYTVVAVEVPRNQAGYFVDNFSPDQEAPLYQDPVGKKQSILDKLRSVAKAIIEKGISGRQLFESKKQEMEAAGVTLDDINAVLLASLQPTRPPVEEVTPDASMNGVLASITAMPLNTSDETNKMQSGATWQSVFGEVPEGDQLYFVSKLNDMLEDGLRMVRIAMQEWGIDPLVYGPKLFQVIKNMSGESPKKAVLLATFLGELQQAKLNARNIDTKRRIQALESQVFAYYQHYMNIQGKKVAAGRLLRIYRDRYLAEFYEDMILEESTLRARAAVERALTMPVDSRSEAAPRMLTPEEKVSLDEISAKRSKQDAANKAKQPKSSAAEARRRASEKAKEIMGKTGTGSMNDFFSKLADKSKKIACR